MNDLHDRSVNDTNGAGSQVPARRCLILILLVLLYGYVPAAAQTRRLGLGLRAAIDGVGFSGKYFLDPGFALEAQINAGGLRLLEGRSYSTSTLVTYNLPLPIRVMRIYFGGGCHAGIWTGRQHSGHPDEWIFGIDGIGGMEVFFRQIPVSISGELKPALNYLQEVDFFPHNLLGMTFRYYFGSHGTGRATSENGLPSD